MNFEPGVVAALADKLFAQESEAQARHTDRVFVLLMLLQWVGAIVIALVVSPATWIGNTSYVHLHVWAALFLGGLVTLFPVILALRRPGRLQTRYVIGVAQMCWSALLIHFTGGRIETHFHVFGSLAFLACYRDWRVLGLASVVIAVDHFVRGIWWPASVFGVFVESPYRWIEHAAWVVFEDIFLLLSCRRDLRLSKNNADRQALLGLTNERVETEVRERTGELERKNVRLNEEIVERRRAETANKLLHRELMEQSRNVGRSEMATSVLHNVGNVLNSVNVSAQVMVDRLVHGKTGSLGKLVRLLPDNKHALTLFLESERGGHIVPYLTALARHMASEKSVLLQELQSLTQNLEHLNDIVNTQQSYAKSYGVVEKLPIVNVIEDALKISSAALDRHQVTVRRNYDGSPIILTDRHKLLEILVNLLSNAKYALSGRDDGDKTIVLGISSRVDTVIITVADNGVGIAKEHLTEIFRNGFTTRPDGHGFGLHSSALKAKELGGVMSVRSEGPGCGAEFTVELPRDVRERRMPWNSEALNTESVGSS